MTRSLLQRASRACFQGLLAGSLVLLPAFLLSCFGEDPEDVVVLAFNLDSTKLGKSDSLRFEIYNGKAPGPGDSAKPVQVITVKTPKDTRKVEVKLSDKVQSDFSVVVIGFDSTGAAQRKLFEFDDFAPDKDVPPAVLLATITAFDLEMRPGETKAAAITLKPSDAADKRVSLASTDTSVIKVVGPDRDSLKAIAEGASTITITALVGGAKASFTVTVSSSVRVTAVTAQPLSGVVGDTLIPQIAFVPSDATNKGFTLKSLDTGIVTVAGQKVVGKAAGSGKVEVTTQDGGRKDTFDVAIANRVIRVKDISSKALSGLVGDTLAPELTFDPSEANDKSFSLKSLDTSVAAIVGLKVVGRAEGKTRVEVTATDGGIKDTFDVTVSKVPIRVKGVQGRGARGLPGDTVVPELDWNPADATDKDFSLRSLDTAVAKIQGLQIVAVALGTARIEVTAQDGGAQDTFDMAVVRAGFKLDVLPITSLKCNPCHIPGQIFNFQDSLVFLRKGVAALDRLQRGPDAPGKMPLKGAPNGDVNSRQLGVLLDWLKRNVVAVTGMSAQDLTLTFGDTAEAKVTFAPAGATNQTFSLIAGDTTLISITADNRILPLKVGTSNVTAQSDENTAFKAQFKVTVGAPSFQRNVLPITSFKCAPCHVPGQTFDFQDSSLLILTGTQALDRLQRDSLAAGKMPLRGAPNGDLTPHQKNILLAWLNAKVVPLKGITVPDDSVLVGQKKAPAIVFDPPNASNRSYLLASADTAKVIIDGGEFEGVAPGTANVEVRALSGNFVKIISVKVKPVPVDSIRVTDDAGAIGDTIVPEVKIFPSNAAVQTFALSLPNASSILSVVPGNQKLVCLAVGRDTVLATSTDGGKVDSFVVVVGPVLPKSLVVRDTNGVIGQTIPITAVWTPVNTTNKNLTLTLAPADTGKASVSGTSLLAKAVGTATVTARSVADTSIKDTFLFTVGPVPVVSLSVPASVLPCSSTISPTGIIVWNPANATNKGFTLSLVPATTRMALVGSTSVKGLKTGITPVTVTSADGGKTATWNINVIRTAFTGTVKNIFTNKCGECHGPVVWPTRNWQDSAQVVSFRATITTRINAGDGTRMPPTDATKGPLSVAELKVLRDWLAVE